MVAPLPIFTAEWLALLLRDQEVPGSNFGLETGCLDCFRNFPEQPQTHIFGLLVWAL